MTSQTFRHRSQLAKSAELGLRREQPFKHCRIALVAVLLVVLWGVLS